MRYEVRLTSIASEYIKEAERYIAWDLKEPRVARRWRESLLNEIAALESLPARYPLMNREPWHSRGFRKMTFRNFLVYYFVDKEAMIVWVVAVIYGRRDQLIALKESIPE